MLGITLRSAMPRLRNPLRRSVSDLVLAALPAVGVLPSTTLAQNPVADGEWTPPFSLNLIAIHAAMLPTGKVLFFSAEHGVPGIHGWILDPVTLAQTEVAPPPPWNPDCSGHSFLPDGRLLVAGGTLAFMPLTGSKKAYVFNPYTLEWGPLPDMADGRWYPSNVTLPDGRVLVMAGLSQVPGVDNPDIEVFDRFAPAAWTLLGQKSLPYYPMLHVLPAGTVFRAGPDPNTETYDPETDTWTPVDTTNFGGRYEAPSVPLPPTLARVMLIGGTTGSGNPTSSCEVIDLSEPVPAWAGTAHMAFPRMEHDAVILPDGTILVVGGRSNGSGPPQAVLVPEVFDPETMTWDSWAPHQVPRMYHSTALLLPDGRVLAAGGNNQPSGEIFSPPYLFQGPRPVITSAPPAIVYGNPFDLSFTSGTTQNKIVLIRMSSVTHSTNMGQRYVPLVEVTGGSGTYSVPAPADGNVAPPGFYMLFVVDETGVPSVSSVLRVDGPLPDCNGNGVADDLDIAMGASTDFDQNLIPDECQSLSVDVASISVSAGGAQNFTLDAGTAFGGGLYLLLGSITGTSPGIPVGPFVVPLEPDVYFLLTASNPNFPPLSTSLGTLDSTGGGAAQFSLPPLSSPSLVGAEAFHAYVVLGPSLVEFASNWMPLKLVP